MAIKMRWTDRSPDRAWSGSGDRRLIKPLSRQQTHPPTWPPVETLLHSNKIRQSISHTFSPSNYFKPSPWSLYCIFWLMPIESTLINVERSVDWRTSHPWSWPQIATPVLWLTWRWLDGDAESQWLCNTLCFGQPNRTDYTHPIKLLNRCQTNYILLTTRTFVVIVLAPSTAMS